MSTPVQSAPTPATPTYSDPAFQNLAVPKTIEEAHELSKTKGITAVKDQFAGKAAEKAAERALAYAASGNIDRAKQYYRSALDAHASQATRDAGWVTKLAVDNTERAKQERAEAEEYKNFDPTKYQGKIAEAEARLNESIAKINSKRITEEGKARRIENAKKGFEETKARYTQFDESHYQSLSERAANTEQDANRLWTKLGDYSKFVHEYDPDYAGIEYNDAFVNQYLSGSYAGFVREARRANDPPDISSLAGQAAFKEKHGVDPSTIKVQDSAGRERSLTQTGASVADAGQIYEQVKAAKQAEDAREETIDQAIFTAYRKADAAANAQGGDISSASVKVAGDTVSIKFEGTAPPPETFDKAATDAAVMQETAYENPDHNLMLGTQKIGDIINQEAAKAEKGESLLFTERTVYDPKDVDRFIKEYSAGQEFQKAHENADFSAAYPKQRIGLQPSAPRLAEVRTDTGFTASVVMPEPPKFNKAEIVKSVPPPSGNIAADFLAGAKGEAENFVTSIIAAGYGLKDIWFRQAQRTMYDQKGNVVYSTIPPLPDYAPTPETDVIGVSSKAAIDLVSTGKTSVQAADYQKIGQNILDNPAFAIGALGVSAATWLFPVGKATQAVKGVSKLAKTEGKILTTYAIDKALGRPTLSLDTLIRQSKIQPPRIQSQPTSYDPFGTGWYQQDEISRRASERVAAYLKEIERAEDAKPQIGSRFEPKDISVKSFKDENIPSATTSGKLRSIFKDLYKTEQKQESRTDKIHEALEQDSKRITKQEEQQKTFDDLQRSKQRAEKEIAREKELEQPPVRPVESTPPSVMINRTWKQPTIPLGLGGLTGAGLKVKRLLEESTYSSLSYPPDSAISMKPTSRELSLDATNQDLTSKVSEMYQNALKDAMNVKEISSTTNKQADINAVESMMNLDIGAKLEAAMRQDYAQMTRELTLQKTIQTHLQSHTHAHKTPDMTITRNVPDVPPRTPPKIPPIPDMDAFYYGSKKGKKKNSVDYDERLWNISPVEFLLHGKGNRIDDEFF